ncbi:MAG: polysaccharide biosynthesis C-terminal domain-containing protein, partial [Clostridia bacterium]|nr:polysaccharide biosynthesis C-terminal domain-containing protein [Clostridia bacterium]
LSIGTAIVPTLSLSLTAGENKTLNVKTKLAIKIAWLIALPCFIGVMIFSKEIISVLYSGGLENTVIDEFLIAANLLKLSSISIIYIAFLQIFTATLQAYKKSYVPLISLCIAVIFKVVLNLILIPIPTINIVGAVIANIFCYFTACALNLLYLRKIIDLKINLKKFAIIPIVSALIMSGACLAIFKLLKPLVNIALALIIAVLIGALVYLVLIILLKVFETEEKSYMPFLKRKVKV